MTAMFFGHPILPLILCTPEYNLIVFLNMSKGKGHNTVIHIIVLPVLDY